MNSNDLQSYILLLISVGIIIAVTTSLGLAAEPSVEITVTDVGWNEIVTSNGTIGIGGISINVTNNSPDTFKNFQICAQLNSIATTLSDIACVDTGTLSPFSQTGFTKDGLPINFVNNLQVSELNILSLNATIKSQLATNVAAEQDITINSGGGGGSFGGAGAGASSSTIVLFEVHLYQVSWNTCNNNIMTVIAGPPSGGLGVKLRTAKSGLVTVTLAEDQPYTNKFVFEGQIEPSESFVMVQVEAISGRGAQIVQEYIDIKECFGTIIFEKESSVPVPPTTPPTPTPSMPIHVPFHTMAPKISEGVTFETSYNDTNFEINSKMDTGIINEMYVEEGASKLAPLETSVVPEFILLTVAILLITLVSVIVVTRLKTLQGVQ